jgi:tetrapyrrole methylase family protein/MazG family protein/ATP diphosphatase
MKPIYKLLEIMARLRDPETGCPWDREQDFSTLAPYTLEEAYELVDAIRRDDIADIRDELGDLLLQVVFHSRVAEEAGAFTFDDVADSIGAKMLRRHPHVFGTDEEKDVGAVAGSWDRIKADERRASSPADKSVLDGIAGALPSLKRAEKLGKRAASVGFDWPDREGPLAKIVEELSELQGAMTEGNRAREAEELGDLLFAVANLARHLTIDPEDALAAANHKFERRFREMEQAVGKDGTSLSTLDLETLEAHWQTAKSR